MIRKLMRVFGEYKSSGWWQPSIFTASLGKVAKPGACSVFVGSVSSSFAGARVKRILGVLTPAEDGEYDACSCESAGRVQDSRVGRSTCSSNSVCQRVSR